jgi:starch phosphorylase
MNCLKRLQRFFSSLVVVTFFVTNTLTPAPIAYGQTVENPAKFFNENAFKIPVEFGKVTDMVKSSDGSPLLIHIQEAHANYDAQNNIKNILEHLSKNYGVNLILLEGAGNKLQPELFNFFPKDKELHQAVTENLIKAGELTGAEVMLIDAGDKKIEGWGVESAGAYAKNRAAYQKVYEGRKLTGSFLGAFYRQWQKTADQVLNKSLRELLDREIAFEEERLPLQDWMAFLQTAAASNLKLDLDDIQTQREWPFLTRYFRLKKIGSKTDLAKARKEQEAFLKDLETRKVPEELLQEIKKLLDYQKAGDLPLYKTRFAFERLMDFLPQDYSFEAYPVFRLHLQQIILLSELQGEQLQEEIKALAQKMTAGLIKTEQDRKLIETLEHYRLLKKLFELELSRKEFQELQSHKTAPKEMAASLGLNPSKLSPITSLFGTAVLFYQGAIERENHMMENAAKILAGRKDKKAVIITGGFHTDGLKEKITASGNSYIGITPAIGEITADSQKNYLAALLGSGAFSHSYIAPEAVTQPAFFQAVSPRFWRRELAIRLARIRDIVRQTVASFGSRATENRAEFDSGFQNLIASIVGVPEKATVVTASHAQPSAARSETRADKPAQSALSALAEFHPSVVATNVLTRRVHQSAEDQGQTPQKGSATQISLIDEVVPLFMIAGMTGVMAWIAWFVGVKTGQTGPKIASGMLTIMTLASAGSAVKKIVSARRSETRKVDTQTFKDEKPSNSEALKNMSPALREAAKFFLKRYSLLKVSIFCPHKNESLFFVDNPIQRPHGKTPQVHVTIKENNGQFVVKEDFPVALSRGWADTVKSGSDAVAIMKEMIAHQSGFVVLEHWKEIAGRSEMREGEPVIELQAGSHRIEANTQAELVSGLKAWQKAGLLPPQEILEIDVASRYGVEVAENEFLVVKHKEGKDSEGTLLHWNNEAELLSWLVTATKEVREASKTAPPSETKAPKKQGPQGPVFQRLVQGNNIEIFPLAGREKELSALKEEPVLVQSGEDTFFVKVTVRNPKTHHNPFGFGVSGGILTESLSKKHEFSVVMIVVSEWKRENAQTGGRSELREFLQAFVPMFFAINALGVLPFVMAIMENAKTASERFKIIRNSLITATFVAGIFLVFGDILLKLLGLDSASFSIAGGIVLFLISIENILGHRDVRISFPQEMASVPIGVPFIVGPAVITTILALKTQYGTGITGAVTTFNILIAGGILYFGASIQRFLGKNGIKTLSKVTSLLLASMGVAMIIKGLITTFPALQSTSGQEKPVPAQVQPVDAASRSELRNTALEKIQLDQNTVFYIKSLAFRNQAEELTRYLRGNTLARGLARRMLRSPAEYEQVLDEVPLKAVLPVLRRALRASVRSEVRSEGFGSETEFKKFHAFFSGENDKKRKYGEAMKFLAEAFKQHIFQARRERSMKTADLGALFENKTSGEEAVDIFQEVYLPYLLAFIPPMFVDQLHELFIESWVKDEMIAPFNAAKLLEDSWGGQLEKKLRDPAKAVRVDALKALAIDSERGDMTVAPPSKNNNVHVHSKFSYSPYYPEEIAYRLFRAGLRNGGIIDHDTTAGNKDFLDAAEILGMKKTSGFEMRVSFGEDAPEIFRDLIWNAPGVPNMIYFLCHALPDPSHPLIRELLGKVRASKERRNRAMLVKVNEKLQALGIHVSIDYDKNILEEARLQVQDRNTTDRHLMAGVAYQLGDNLGYYKTILGDDALAAKAVAGYKAGDIDVPMEILRGAFLKPSAKLSCFIAPDAEESPSMKTVVEIIKKAGGIPIYPYLGDSKGSKTHEEEHLDELFKYLVSIGVPGIAIMPHRNSDEEIVKVVALAKRYGLRVFSGVDINKPDMPFLEEKGLVELPDVFDPADVSYNREVGEDFLKGGDFLVGHEFLARHAEFGFYSIELAKLLPEENNRFDFLASVGAYTSARLSSLSREFQNTPEIQSSIIQGMVDRWISQESARSETRGKQSDTEDKELITTTPEGKVIRGAENWKKYIYGILLVDPIFRELFLGAGSPLEENYRIILDHRNPFFGDFLDYEDLAKLIQRKDGKGSMSPKTINFREGIALRKLWAWHHIFSAREAKKAAQRAAAPTGRSEVREQPAATSRSGVSHFGPFTKTEMMEHLAQLIGQMWYFGQTRIRITLQLEDSKQRSYTSRSLAGWRGQLDGLEGAFEEFFSSKALISGATTASVADPEVTEISLALHPSRGRSEVRKKERTPQEEALRETRSEETEFANKVRQDNRILSEQESIFRDYLETMDALALLKWQETGDESVFEENSGLLELPPSVQINSGYNYPVFANDYLGDDGRVLGTRSEMRNKASEAAQWLMKASTVAADKDSMNTSPVFWMGVIGGLVGKRPYQQAEKNLIRAADAILNRGASVPEDEDGWKALLEDPLAFEVLQSTPRSEMRIEYETRRALLEQMAQKHAFIPFLGYAAVVLYNEENKTQISVADAATNAEVQAKILGWAIKKYGAVTIPSMMDLALEHEAVILANLPQATREAWTREGKIQTINGKETLIRFESLSRPALHMTLSAAGIDWRHLKNVDLATTGRLGVTVETLQKLDEKASQKPLKIAYSVAPYTLAAFLMGDDAAMMAMMDHESGETTEDTEMFLAVMKYSENLIAAHAERLVKEGRADAVVFLDPRPTPMISPEYFLKYSVDPVNRLSRIVRSLGALSVAHPCRPKDSDMATKLLPVMAHYDVDILSVDAIYYLLDVYKYIEESSPYERKPIIAGNMDTLAVLPSGSVTEVAQAAAWIFEAMAYLPFIFATSCDIESVTPQNMASFAAAAFFGVAALKFRAPTVAVTIRSEARSPVRYRGGDFLPNDVANLIGMVKQLDASELEAQDRLIAVDRELPYRGMTFSGQYSVTLRLSSGDAMSSGDLRNDRLIYDFYVRPKEQVKTLADAIEQSFYKGFVFLNFDGKGKLASWEVPDIRSDRKEQFPWLENFLAEELRARKGLSFKRTQEDPFPRGLTTLSLGLDPEARSEIRQDGEKHSFRSALMVTDDEQFSGDFLPRMIRPFAAEKDMRFKVWSSSDVPGAKALLEKGGYDVIFVKGSLKAVDAFQDLGIPIIFHSGDPELVQKCLKKYQAWPVYVFATPFSSPEIGTLLARASRETAARRSEVRGAQGALDEWDEGDSNWEDPQERRLQELRVAISELLAEVAKALRRGTKLYQEIKSAARKVSQDEPPTSQELHSFVEAVRGISEEKLVLPAESRMDLPGLRKKLVAQLSVAKKMSNEWQQMSRSRKSSAKTSVGARYFDDDRYRSEMREEDSEEESEADRQAREISRLQGYFQSGPKGSPEFLKAREYLLSLEPEKAIDLLFNTWGTNDEVLAAIKKKAGKKRAEAWIIASILKHQRLSEEAADLLLAQGFLSSKAKNNLLRELLTILEQPGRQDPIGEGERDLNGIRSSNESLLRILAVCLQRIRPPLFTFNRFRDLLSEYAFNLKSTHSYSEHDRALMALEALGEGGLAAILDKALTLERGKFDTKEGYKDLSDLIESVFKRHKEFYYPRLIAELGKPRYNERNTARILDYYGAWDAASLPMVFSRQAENFQTKFNRLFAEKYPSFTEIVGSPLWAGVKGDPARAQEALDSLDDFTTQFLSRCSAELGKSPEEKLKILIQGWRYERVLRWALAWKEAKERNAEPDPRIFNILMAPEVQTGMGGDYGLVLEKALEYDDPNLLQETFFYLLCTEARLSRLLPDLVKFIIKHPLETTSLIPLLVTRLRLDAQKFSELQAITKLLAALLNKRHNSDIFLIRKLVQAVPYPRALSNIGSVRKQIEDLDDQYGKKGFLRFLRMSIHRSPSSENLKMMEMMLRAVGQERLDPFLQFVPEEFRADIERESEEQKPLLVSWNKAIQAVANGDGPSKIRSAEDLINLPDEKLEGFIASIPDDGPGGERHGLILLLRTYHSLRARYLGSHQVSAASEAEKASAQGQYLAAVFNLTRKIMQLDQEMDFEEPEEVFERTYATDHSINEEERWGFEPKGYALATQERSVVAFENTEVLRQSGLRAFEQYLEQLSKDYFNEGQESKGVREAALQEFDSSQLKMICGSLQRFLKFLETAGFGSQDFQELGDVLLSEDLSVAQVKDVFAETAIRTQRLMYVLQLWFGGHGRKIAGYLGEERIRTFLGSAATASRDGASFADLARIAEQKLIGDLLAEEGLILFQNFLRKNIAILEALETRGPPLKVTRPKRKDGSENVVLFYRGMKRKGKGPLLASQFGNKGIMLQKMAEAGYPVPPGFTISTDYLNQLTQKGQEVKLRSVVFKYILELEKKSGRHFPFNPDTLTDRERTQLEESRSGWPVTSREPLIVSVRSGAFVPLPGVLDTFLKLPVTQRVLQQLIDAGIPKRVALDDRRRYLTSYATAVLGFQEAFFSQLIESVKVQMGMSGHSVSEFDDAQMERLVRSCENEIQQALLHLETIAHTPLEGSDWQERLIKNLNLLRGTEVDQAQIHASTHFGMDYKRLKELILKGTPEAKEQVEGLIRDFRKRFEEWTAIKKTYDGDEFEILLLAVNEISKSWRSHRAREAREGKGISDAWGTPATVQVMMSGNRPGNSGAFVAQTHHPVTGALMPDGDFKPQGEGEDLVAGRTREAWRIRPPQVSDKKSLKNENPTIFDQLVTLLKEQSRFGGGPRQIEGIVQDSESYILQNIGLNLIGSFPRLLPTETQKPIMRGEGGAGGAKHVRIFFDRDSFSKLETRIEALRKKMDAAGEKDIGIALITRYVTPEEARKVHMKGVDALIVTAVGGSSHAAIAARDADKILISSVSALKKHPAINKTTQEIVEVWSLDGQDLVEGMEEGSKIYSIDGNYSGPTAGCIYEGKIEIEKRESDEQSLSATLAARAKDLPSRSELRRDIQALMEERIKGLDGTYPKIMKTWEILLERSSLRNSLEKINNAKDVASLIAAFKEAETVLKNTLQEQRRSVLLRAFKFAKSELWISLGVSALFGAIFVASPKEMKWITGLLFAGIGLWTLVPSYFRWFVGKKQPYALSDRRMTLSEEVDLYDKLLLDVFDNVMLRTVIQEEHAISDSRREAISRSETRETFPAVRALIEDIQTLERSHWPSNFAELRIALSNNQFGVAARLVKALEPFRRPEAPLVGQVIDRVQTLRSELRISAKAGEEAVRARLEILAENENPDVSRQATQFLKSGLVSGGRKGSANLARAREFINGVVDSQAGRSEVRSEASDLSQTPGHDLIQKLFELKTLNKSFAEDLVTPDKIEDAEALRKELVTAVKEMVFRLSRNLMYELLTHRRLYRAIARALGRELLAIENDFLPIPLLRYLNERSLPESRYNAWEHIAFNNVFLDVLIQIARAFDQYLQNKETWIQKNRPDLLGKRILYFSAEFGMKSLQIYGGGLGILSGDHVRGSSDIGLDGFQAVGLLYKKGYFRQVITKDGRQEVDESYEGINFANLPLEAVKDPEHPEQDFILSIPFPDRRNVRAKVWKTVYGKTSMYLLDTDVEGNSDTDRTITRELYRGNGESKERLEQYYVLGAGGMMAMRALGKEPDVLHLNDCHPVFSALQLIASTMKEIPETVKDPKQRFEMALLKASARTVFTTHTPIAAGNEAPSLDVMRPFLENIFGGDRYAVDRILSLGILDGRFNIAAFSQRVSEFHNGVSELHGHVSQAMWKRLYPGVKLEAVPIPGIVNSVHTPYWQIPEIAELFKRTFEDPEVKRLMESEDPTELKKKLEDPSWVDEHIKVDSKRLWSIHFERKQKLLTELEIRLGRRLQRNEAQRANPDEVRFLAQFDPGALTIGFARRAIPYKRMTLAFQDVKRLAKIAVRAGKPIQFVFGGKAHPKDRDSQELIRKLHGLARRAIDEAVAEEEAQHPERKGKIKPEQALIKFHFLEEYNVDIARYLESGVDVWLNAPVRPLEASGTSGMKAAMNGVLNLSICDGWSAEGIIHGINGWLFGIRGGERNDMADAEDFYRKLEEVVDTYYSHPDQWIRMAKASIVSTSYWFGMERMLRDYARLMYAPAVANGEKMAETEVYDHAAKNLEIREAILAHPTVWQQATVENFPAHAVTGKEVEMSVILPTDGLPPEYFAVDLILDGMKGTRWEGMDRIEKIEEGKYRYVVKFKPEETDFYRKAKFRITPANPRIWLNPEELDYVTRYIDTPAGLNVYDESLLKFRAESTVEQGMLFFVQIPDEVGVQQMQWTGDPVNWDLADARFGMQRVKDGLWATVVPQEILEHHQPVKFKFYMNMPKGHFVEDHSLLWLTGTYPVREGNAQVYLNPEDPFFNREKARNILAAASGVSAPASTGRSEVRGEKGESQKFSLTVIESKKQTLTSRDKKWIRVVDQTGREGWYQPSARWAGSASRPGDMIVNTVEIRKEDDGTPVFEVPKGLRRSETRMEDSPAKRKALVRDVIQALAKGNVDSEKSEHLIQLAKSDSPLAIFIIGELIRLRAKTSAELTSVADQEALRISRAIRPGLKMPRPESGSAKSRSETRGKKEEGEEKAPTVSKTLTEEQRQKRDALKKDLELLPDNELLSISAEIITLMRISESRRRIQKFIRQGSIPAEERPAVIGIIAAEQSLRKNVADTALKAPFYTRLSNLTGRMITVPKQWLNTVDTDQEKYHEMILMPDRSEHGVSFWKENFDSNLPAIESLVQEWLQAKLKAAGWTAKHWKQGIDLQRFLFQSIPGSGERSRQDEYYLLAWGKKLGAWDIAIEKTNESSAVVIKEPAPASEAATPAAEETPSIIEPERNETPKETAAKADGANAVPAAPAAEKTAKMIVLQPDQVKLGHLDEVLKAEPSLTGVKAPFVWQIKKGRRRSSEGNIGPEILGQLVRAGFFSGKNDAKRAAGIHFLVRLFTETFRDKTQYPDLNVASKKLLFAVFFRLYFETGSEDAASLAGATQKELLELEAQAWENPADLNRMFLESLFWIGEDIFNELTLAVLKEEKGDLDAPAVALLRKMHEDIEESGRVTRQRIRELKADPVGKYMTGITQTELIFRKNFERLLSRSEVRANVNAKDQVRVMTSDEWFFAEDLDRTLMSLAQVVRQAETDRKPVRLVAVSKTPDQDELLTMLGFAPTSPRQDQERAFLGTIPERLATQTGFSFARTGSNVTLSFSTGEQVALVLTSERRSNTFENLLKNSLEGVEKQRGLESFTTEIQKGGIRLKNPRSVEFFLTAEPTLVTELGLDPASFADVVISEPEYATLPSTTPEKAPETKAVEPSAQAKTLSQVLVGIQEAWNTRESHWAVQRVKEDEAALTAWDALFKAYNSRNQEALRHSEEKASIEAQMIYQAMYHKSVPAEEIQGAKEMARKLFGKDLVDDRAYSQALQSEASLQELIRSPVDPSDAGALKTRIEKIFRELVKLQNLIRNRTLAFSKYPVREVRPEIQYFFIKDIVQLHFLQKVSAAILNGNDKELANFSIKMLRQQTKIRVVKKEDGQKASSSGKADRKQVLTALKDLESFVQERKAFYDARHPSLAQTVGRIYGEALEVSLKLPEMEAEKEFTLQLRQMLDLLVTVWSSDQTGLWSTGMNTSFKIDEATKARFQKIMERIMIPLLMDTSEEVRTYAFGEKAPEQARSEVRESLVSMPPAIVPILQTQMAQDEAQAPEKQVVSTILYPLTFSETRTSFTTVEQFVEENVRLGGGRRVRDVTEKIMDGIIPLLAHTLNAVELLMPAASRIPAIQKIHAAAAKRVLGLAPDAGYGFVLGLDLALGEGKGMLAIAKTIFPGSSFVILVKDPTKVPDVEKLLLKEGLQDRVFVITDAKLARAKISRPGISIKGMISSDELMLAEELKAELKDDLIVMDKGMRQRFLNAAGQLFQSLADKIAAQFAVLRSA